MRTPTIVAIYLTTTSNPTNFRDDTSNFAARDSVWHHGRGGCGSKINFTSSQRSDPCLVYGSMTHSPYKCPKRYQGPPVVSTFDSNHGKALVTTMEQAKMRIIIFLMKILHGILISMQLTMSLLTFRPSRLLNRTLAKAKLI